MGPSGLGLGKESEKMFVVCTFKKILSLGVV